MKRRHCARCKRPMRRHGFTAKGTPRWRCAPCNRSRTWTRKDTASRHLRTQFTRWITGTSAASDIAKELGMSRKQLSERFRECWQLPPPPPPAANTRDKVLIADATYLSGRTNAVLIARNSTHVRFWDFCPYECAAAWDGFFAHIPQPQVVVIDGQKGLSQAVLLRFPKAKVQRCLVHVERFVRMCVSTRPKTEAGRAIWKLTRSLWKVETQNDAQAWREEFLLWSRTYKKLLEERSVSSETGRWWYTHRKLRAARTHLLNALPHLFTFTVLPGVPKTTNGVEGGVNARLKELLHRHRGLSPERKRILAAYYLATKTKQNATRKVT